MQVTDDLIRSVVQDVLKNMGNGRAAPAANGNGRDRRWGVFDDVDSAASAAREAQRQYEARGVEDRRKAVHCVRKICTDRAEELGREELAETKIGRLNHKIEKLIVAGEKTPGVEFLRSDAWSGEHG